VTWVSGVTVYVCLWWLVLFAVLPFGVRPAETHQAGHDAGAPANPRLPLKLAATTAISAALWLAVWAAIHSGLFSFREL
jgi:predicted secreted protein